MRLSYSCQSSAWILVLVLASHHSFYNVCFGQVPKETQAANPPIDLRVLNAWKGVRAKYRTGYSVYSMQRPNIYVDMPIFELDPNDWRNVQLTELPEPEVPFGLQLSGNHPLTGLLDSNLQELTRFKNLQYLYLRTYYVTNEGMKSIGKLSSLRDFKLSASTTGPKCPEITDEGFKELGKLVDLRRLSLSQSLITDAGVAELAPLKSLQYLNLAYTRVTGKGLRAFTGLQELHLGETQFDDEGLKDLAALPTLRFVDFYGTNLRGRGLAQLVHLQVARLSSLRTRISRDGIKELAELPELTFVSLSRIDDEDLRCLTASRSLVQLSCSDSEMTDVGLLSLAKFPKLEVLNLSRCKMLTDKGYQHLAEASRLKKLTLLQQTMSDDSLTNLSALPNLESLNLTNLTGPSRQGLYQLSKCKNLKELELSSVKNLEGKPLFSHASELKELKRNLPGVTIELSPSIPPSGSMFRFGK